MGEKINNIIIWDHDWLEDDKDHTEYGLGSVPLQWSWEDEEYWCTPKAFLLYVVNDNFVEMRQIYIAQRYREQGIGSRIMKLFENRVKELVRDKVHIYVRFTDHDPDNIFHDFLVSQGYKADKEQPNQLWVKQL